MAEAQKPYGKSLFFSKLQMIPVKEEEQRPVEAGQRQESGNRDGGNQKVSASYLRRDTEQGTGNYKKKTK